MRDQKFNHGHVNVGSDAYIAPLFFANRVMLADRSMHDSCWAFITRLPALSNAMIGARAPAW